MTPPQAPPFLVGEARRDWSALYARHYCPVHPRRTDQDEPHFCEADTPELLPHHCSIRAVLEDDRVIARWMRLRLDLARQEGFE